MVFARGRVSVAPSSFKIIFLHDGSLSTPPPCSQHSITAQRRLSSAWCCLSISSNTVNRKKNHSPSVLQATAGRYFRTNSTVRGGAEKKEREEGGGRFGTDHVISHRTWSVALFPCRLSPQEPGNKASHPVPIQGFSSLDTYIGMDSCCHLAQFAENCWTKISTVRSK